MNNQPDVRPADFDANGSCAVSHWTWTVADNGVVVEFSFADDSRRVIAFAPQVAFYLLERLRGLAQEGGFIDLRDIEPPGPPS